MPCRPAIFSPTLLLAAGVHPVITIAQQPDMGRRSTVYAPRAAAATSQPLATAAALEIMQQGGNAVDAAVAAAAVLNVVDLAAHEPRWVQPLSTDFRSCTVWELPPSGQGIAALEMLELVEPLDLEGMGHNSADYLHHLIEAKKLAFADLHRYVSDAETMEIDPMSLLSPGYVDARRALIDPRTAAERVEPGRAVTDSETIYLTVADGNMVSFINSVYSSFGSGIVVPGLGFALQNRGAGFTMAEGYPNAGRPTQAPLPHDHPGFRDQGRRARHGVRGHGRIDAAAGAHAASAQHARLRDGSAGGGGRGAIPAPVRAAGGDRGGGHRGGGGAGGAGA